MTLFRKCWPSLAANCSEEPQCFTPICRSLRVRCSAIGFSLRQLLLNLIRNGSRGDEHRDGQASGSENILAFH